MNRINDSESGVQPGESQTTEFMTRYSDEIHRSIMDNTMTPKQTNSNDDTPYGVEPEPFVLSRTVKPINM